MKNLRRALSMIVSIALLISLCGCWSAKEIQIQSYVKAVGIDYLDNEFIVYLQMLDFTGIAKSSGVSGPTSQAPVWIGKGRGRTLDMAFNDMYKSAQLQVSWGHVTAIVLTDNVLAAKHDQIADMINRYPEIRYNAWLYGTKSSMEELLRATPLFNLSPLVSILHSPESNFKQYSTYNPVLFFQYILDYNEPAVSAYLPSLSLTKKQWKHDETPHDMLMIDGAFFETGRQMKGFLNRNQLAGYHWLLASMDRAPLTIEKEGTLYGGISVKLSNSHIKPVFHGSDVRFHVKATYYGGMYEYMEKITPDEMNRAAEDAIRKQIMDTYKEGLRIGVDVFGLEEKLYRKYPQTWKKLTGNGEHLLLKPDSIEQLDVKVSVPYYGKYKLRLH
ncbi:Ger(x)C family spore germination protein [Paenibacillus mendelii]|uniref:Ger(X)C family spore germination protein n=1 Tax=Paenibacillus mendelii TaxID=206163 RepID=A0ABV6JKQ0_9BACL|nr:Ger(x)C family spore germination protein [Paenibacillus mendelii]MCQ6560665.1 Ger(x)C family spore germination protein [Paenibacillus mendelii]